MRESILPETPESSAPLAVDAVNGAVYTIPLWADGVRISVSGADVRFRVGASTLAGTDIDIAGAARDAKLPNGYVSVMAIGSGLRKLAFRTDAGAAVVDVEPVLL